MPLYDRRCVCGWTAIDVWESVVTETHACPDCGNQTERAWLTKASTVIGDACDFISRNGEAQPVRFRSRADHRRWLAQHGYRIKDEHRPEPGTDKSKFTSNWAQGYDAYTAANVKLLLERAFTQQATEAPEPTMHITTYTGELSAEDVKKYVGQ